MTVPQHTKLGPKGMLRWIWRGRTWPQGHKTALGATRTHIASSPRSQMFLWMDGDKYSHCKISSKVWADELSQLRNVPSCSNRCPQKLSVQPWQYTSLQIRTNNAWRNSTCVQVERCRLNSEHEDKQHIERGNKAECGIISLHAFFCLTEWLKQASQAGTKMAEHE